MADVVIVLGSDSDAPVLKRAMGVLEKFGLDYEVTVSSAHRSPARTMRFAKNAEKNGVKVIIAVAGMEGALASVVGGLVACPVIGVPTSVGYGASFEGLAPLLTMLNSCAPGVAVVNVDNGFGAGYFAHNVMRVMSGK